ncbi:MAG TPA: SRPBCC family protein [Solirubrobacteraceae bacterium]|nr:SRPBCC family protein [Solirubrobacteraceae bacterium]
MPTARRTRIIAASAEELWEVICDPHHLPRWWPRVNRVEDVEDGAFTEVMKTAKGKLVRADFRLVRSDERAHSLAWQQQLEGTPFARLLSSAETRVSLEPVAEGTSVTIELRQRLSGFFPRFGGFMVRRAAAATLDEALSGLERISG